MDTTAGQQRCNSAKVNLDFCLDLKINPSIQGLVPATVLTDFSHDAFGVLEKKPPPFPIKASKQDFRLCRLKSDVNLNVKSV